MMKLLMLAIALGLASADSTFRTRKQHLSHERLLVDADFFDAADVAPLFDSLEDFERRHLMGSMSMSMSTSTSTSTDTTSSAGPYSSSAGPNSSSADPYSTSATPPFLPPVNQIPFKDTGKDEVVVVDISSDGSKPDTQSAGGLSTTATTTSNVATGSAASSSVNVGGVVGSTLACLAALAGAALLIYKRKQDERLDLPMTT